MDVETRPVPLVSPSLQESIGREGRLNLGEGSIGRVIFGQLLRDVLLRPEGDEVLLLAVG